MATAQDRLNQILPSWYDLLTKWSLDGSLVAAATDALMLDGSNAKQDAKGQLQSYVSQWSAGNFKTLPQIVLLSAADISGARGAYADSTDTIYLNQDWLLGASAKDIQAVLTEELGHYLDDQLNEVDTQGDEGEHFSLYLTSQSPGYNDPKILNQQDDTVFLKLTGGDVVAQASSVAPAGSYLSLDRATTDYLATDARYIPESGDFTVSVWAQAKSIVPGGLAEIVSQGITGGTGFYIGYNELGYFRIGDSWGGYTSYGNGIPFPTDGQWHCYQVVKQSHIGYLYVDGQLLATSENYSDPVVGSSGFKNPVGGSNLRIGTQFALAEGVNYDENWDGNIDEVNIFGSALSSQDLEGVRLSASRPSSLIYRADFEAGLGSFQAYGSPTIITTNQGYAVFRINGNGTGQDSQTLTCILDPLNQDPDGMSKNPSSSYTYQWETSTDGTTWTNATGNGANSFKYSVNTTSDANKFLRVQVGYTDDKGFSETVYTEQVKIISGTTKSDKFAGTAGVEVTFSGSGADAVATGAGNDFAKGGIGNDTFTGADGDGDDFFDGQTEIDIINYSASSKGVDIDFVTGLATERTVGGIGKDSFAGIENARGTTGADSFKGSTGVNVFTGSGGADTFNFANAQAFGASTSDRITDISSDDKIQVSASAFSIVGKPYSFAAVSGTKAVNASAALIVYDTGSGYLYLNKDGATSGMGGGGIFAVLDNKFVGLAAGNVSLI